MKTPLVVSNFLDHGAKLYPDRVAVVDEPNQQAPSWGEVTFSDFAAKSRAFAAGLDRLGISAGERVAVISQNNARMLNVICGATSYGRIAVPINFRLNPEEVRFIVEHSGSSVFLIDPELEDIVNADFDVKHRFILGEESDDALLIPDAEPTPWAADEDATGTINYTSGTTGRPKGVQLTHRNIWLNATIFGWSCGLGSYDAHMNIVPIFHCNGWGLPFASLGSGMPQVMLSKVDGAEILRRIERYGVTFMGGAPAVLKYILDASETWDGPIPGAGKMRMVVAGAPPPRKLIERMETDLDWEFIQIYGATETAPLLTMNRRRHEWDDLTTEDRAGKFLRQGAPVLGMDLSLNDSGEVLARGNHIMEGYWEQPDATAAVIQDGWFNIGDVGQLEDDGYLRLHDRSKDIIISGGENISSIEVEDCLFSNPKVSEAAVIGVPHEKWGETVKGLVVLAAAHQAEAGDPAQAEALEAELIEYCRSKLAHFKCPTSVEFLAELPRTSTGKVQKFRLRESYWEGFDRMIN